MYSFITVVARAGGGGEGRGGEGGTRHVELSRINFAKDL